MNYIHFEKRYGVITSFIETQKYDMVGIPIPTDHGWSLGDAVAPLCPCLPRMPWSRDKRGPEVAFVAFCEGVSVIIRNQFRSGLWTVV